MNLLVFVAKALLKRCILKQRKVIWRRLDIAKQSFTKFDTKSPLPIFWYLHFSSTSAKKKLKSGENYLATWNTHMLIVRQSNSYSLLLKESAFSWRCYRTLTKSHVIGLCPIMVLDINYFNRTGKPIYLFQFKSNRRKCTEPTFFTLSIKLLSFHVSLLDLLYWIYL